eukprot:CAMPEP_0116126650 /NCGR_PEP_ID=MMETSP0329-20121206/6441_1 /TAXON_ID=697910 /ORGANISM="Pseudo-nitzschia arenysensis, Strain B593" /LENGTH=274 /DNA_ID=CAMNT_0003620739 /DNA_START=69 /DNA_END=890 /DNA_ORIENTATION=+
MKIAHSMLRQWASKSTGRTSISAIASSRGALGLSSSSTGSPFSYFCTGVSPDLPRMNNVNNNNNNNNLPSRRSFSSKATLLDILSREENEEIDEGNTEMPEELLELRTTIQESWKIVENGATTNLYKIDSDSNKIQVSFHCQDTLEVVEEDAEEYEDEEEDDEEPAAPVRFTVTVTKAGKSLNFACFSEYGEVKIEGVSTTASSTAEYVHEHQGTLPKMEYQGPDLTELAEDFQEGLADYLDEECGVNADVAAFVAMSADYREEINYVDFLKQA